MPFLRNGYGEGELAKLVFARLGTHIHIAGFKITGMLLPGIFVLGSWIAFKFIWNITDETREKISLFKKANKS